MRGSNISPAMREAVGTELYRQVSYPVSESDIRRWAIRLLDELPPFPCQKFALLFRKVLCDSLHVRLDSIHLGRGHNAAP